METPKTYANSQVTSADMMRKYQDMIVENQEEKEEVEEAKEEDTEKEEVEEAKEEEVEESEEQVDEGEQIEETTDTPAPQTAQDLLRSYADLVAEAQKKDNEEDEVREEKDEE